MPGVNFRFVAGADEAEAKMIWRSRLIGEAGILILFDVRLVQLAFVRRHFSTFLL